MDLSPILQPVAVVVPVWAKIGVDAGKYILDGSILREKATGQIVKHLDTIPLALGQLAWAAARQAARAPNARLGAAVIGIGATTLVATKVSQVVRRRSALAEFGVILAEYQAAVQAGRYDRDLAERFIAALDSLPNLRAGRRPVALPLETTEGRAFVGSVRESVLKIAEEKGRTVADFDATASDDNVVDLRRYVEAQRDVLGDAV